MMSSRSKKLAGARGERNQSPAQSSRLKQLRVARQEPLRTCRPVPPGTAKPSC